MAKMSPQNYNNRHRGDKTHYTGHNNDDDADDGAYADHSSHSDDNQTSFVPSWRAISFLTTCTIAAAFCGVLVQAYIESQALSRIMIMASGLARLEQQPDVQVIRRRQQNYGGPDESWPRPRVAVAYGSCNDVVVHVSDFMAYLGDSDGAGTNNGVELNDIAGEEDLLKSFGYYFGRGAAAERYTSNTEWFRELVGRIRAGGRSRSDLGGNAPIMGQQLWSDGADVLIAAQMSDYLRAKVDPQIRTVGPPIDYDDVHLIIEYQTGDRWGPHTAPRANRYILHNDRHNPALSALEHLSAAILPFRPQLLVICGLQMMDSQRQFDGPDGSNNRTQMLRRVGEQMRAVGRSGERTRRHVELASFVEPAFVGQLVAEVLPHADSVGMNEQELEAMVQYTETGTLSKASDSNPRVGSTLDRMRMLFAAWRQLRPASGDADGARLSRIHVHTLAFQAIMVERRTDGTGWRNTRNAAAKASLTAYRRVCRSTIVNPESAAMVLDDSFSLGVRAADVVVDRQGDAPIDGRMYWNASEMVTCWRERPHIGGAVVEVELCVAPVLVCRVAQQTAGAGDSISAAGLILQI